MGIEARMLRKAGFKEAVTRHFLPSIIIYRRIGSVEVNSCNLPREFYEKLVSTGRVVVRGDSKAKRILELLGVKLEYLENTSILEVVIEKTKC